MSNSIRTVWPLALSAALCVAGTGGAAEPANLFNGKDLSGWVQRGGKATYRVEDGAIVGTTVPNTGNSFLCTEESFGDFVLELEVKQHPGVNSGIQFRSHCFEEEKSYEHGDKTIKVPAGRVHGYQFELDPTNRKWTGGIFEEGRRGWLHPLKDKPEAQAAYRLGEWNRLRIECVGNTLRTWVNDVLCSELVDDWSAEGFVGLQVHGVGNRDEPMDIRWRNIRLTRLEGSKKN